MATPLSLICPFRLFIWYAGWSWPWCVLSSQRFFFIHILFVHVFDSPSHIRTGCRMQARQVPYWAALVWMKLSVSWLDTDTDVTSIICFMWQTQLNDDFKRSQSILTIFVASLFLRRNEWVITNYFNYCYSSRYLVYFYENILSALCYPVSRWEVL